MTQTVRIVISSVSSVEIDELLFLTRGKNCQKKVSVSQVWREGGRYGYKGATLMMESNNLATGDELGKRSGGHRQLERPADVCYEIQNVRRRNTFKDLFDTVFEIET